jgi:magnesium transporter
VTYTATSREPDGTQRTLVGREQLSRARQVPGALLWLHASSVTPDEAQLIADVFEVHPLALHDMLNPEYEAPKVDDYGSYLFIKLHGVDHNATDDVVRTTELDLLLGPDWVVSASHSRLPAIDHLLAGLPVNARLLERGSDMLAHVLIDALVDSILPTIHLMDDVADAVESRALEHPRQQLLTDILRLKRSAMYVHRVVVPQREVVYRLSRGEHPLVTEAAAPYFRDVYDHLVRVEDLVLVTRDRAEGALTTYLSATNIRQNETMRVLAIVTSAFLPLTLLTGIYGMNFDHMPELGWPWAYPAVLAVVMVVTTAVSGWLFGGWLLARGRRAVRLTFRVEQRLLNEAIAEAARLRELVINGHRRES